MIEPLTSIAFSVYSNKGIYSLLLGSGLSRSAGVPTGWDIVLDLIRKVAHLQNANCGPDPADWYRTTFGQEPNYADLLDLVARTPTERNQLLRHYFEPTDEEREQNRNTPTAAHHAIAKLVSSGFVRVILTTNFDRLMEQALEAAGIVPTIISTPDAIEGALPLVHTPCTVIKIHGDYLDTRIRNTPDELSTYEERSNRLLDRVFDEYGLIVCGWSAEWDRALLAALERCPSRRFTTYWAIKGTLGEAAQRMVTHRQAIVIPIESADAFFTGVAEKVTSLEELALPHPLSPAIAAATLKRYIGTGQRIRLHDLVIGEVNALRDCLSEPQYSVNEPVTGESIRQRMERYEADTEVMMQIMINGSYWGSQEQNYLWVSCLERLYGRSFNGIPVWLKLSHYPALLLFYSGGLAAVAAGKYDTLTALFKQGRVEGLNRMEAVSANLYPLKVLEKDVMENIPKYKGAFLPGSDYLHDKLSDLFTSLFSSKIHFTHTFDKFEYLVAMYHAFQRKNGFIWGPAGSFLWRGRAMDPQEQVATIVDTELAEMQDDWPPLKANLFPGPASSLLVFKSEFDQFITNWRASVGAY